MNWGYLIEAPCLPIPLLDGVECGLATEVEHEQYCNGIVTDEGQHIDKLSLATEIPYGERYLCVADADCLLHKVDACVSPAREVDTKCLYIIFIKGSLDVFDHETRLANGRVANHADLDHDTASAHLRKSKPVLLRTALRQRSDPRHNCNMTLHASPSPTHTRSDQEAAN
jgi:hypothetical protein